MLPRAHEALRCVATSEFHDVPTPTCCAVGSDSSERLGPITEHLKLL